ncbi:MAG: DUF6512 family protein [Actinobacteria bacterium]|nr:DUF6512 family protein [Actinomycetota bacterium]
MNRKKILSWEMFGILFTVLAGSLLHFTFELSGEWTPMAIISGVNESTWEHFKIGFWPIFVWGIIEFFVFGRKVKNFFFAKGISFLVIPAVISALFYGYTFIFKIESLAIDIVIFIIAIAVAQIVSYRLMLLKERKLYLNIIGGIIIVVNIVLFSLLSFFPPECLIFKDPVTGGYGIVEHNH